MAELKEEALKLAANADLIIYVGGITAAQEGEGFDRSAIELPEPQTQLIRALHETGKPMVMVNCSGSCIALTWEDEHLNAILQAWYPGQNGGQAVAEALFGELNPSGHLPLTFYRATEDLPDVRDYSMENRTYKFFKGKPLYAFGHGLSYTNFEYKDGKLDASGIPADGAQKYRLRLQTPAALTAMMWLKSISATSIPMPQPKLALCGFSRVHVKHGQSTQVTIEIPAERLRYWDTEKKQYVVSPGDYELLIGAASDDIRLKLPMKITAL